MRPEELIDPSQLPAEWAAKRVTIAGYQTRSSIEAFSGVCIKSSGFLLLFHAGELTYAESVAEPGVELVGGQVKISFGQTDFARTKSSRWLVVVRPEANPPVSLKTIEGILRTVIAPRLLLHKTFERSIDLADGTTGVSSCTLLNPLLMGPEAFSVTSITAIDNAASTIERLPLSDRALLVRSIEWMNDSYTGNDIWDSFLKIWIALEMLFVRGGNAVSALRSAIKAAYGIASTNERVPFDMGRIYGVRKSIVHNGELPKYDWRFIDFLWELYRDLFAWKLTGTCPKLAARYLQAIKATVRQLIDNTVPDQ